MNEDMPRMCQQMTPIEDNIRYTNAPSQNAIDEAYQRGYMQGYMQSIDDLKPHIDKLGSQHKSQAYDVIFCTLDRLLCRMINNINHHHRDE